MGFGGFKVYGLGLRLAGLGFRVEGRSSLRAPVKGMCRDLLGFISLNPKP